MLMWAALPLIGKDRFRIVVMLTATIVPVVGDADGQRLIYTKRNIRLGGNPYTFAAREDLSTCSSSCTSRGSNRSPLSAACDRADDSSQQGATAHVLRGALISS